jgi:hypothetical protein
MTFHSPVNGEKVNSGSEHVLAAIDGSDLKRKKGKTKRDIR